MNIEQIEAYIETSKVKTAKAHEDLVFTLRATHLSQQEQDRVYSAARRLADLLFQEERIANYCDVLQAQMEDRMDTFLAEIQSHIRELDRS